MINLNNIPKKYLLAGLGVLIIILASITLLNPSNFGYKDTTDYVKQGQLAAAEQKEYADYLASIKPDPAASTQLYQSLLNQKDVEAEVSTQLNITQKITIPTIADSQIAIASKGGKDAVVNYYQTVGAIAGDLNTQVSPTVKNLFSQDQSVDQLNQSLAATNAFLDKMYKTPVPPEAVAYHKAELVAFDNLRGLIGQAQNYVAQADTNPWPKVYAKYAVINDRVATADSEFQKMDSKYKLSEVVLPRQIAAAPSTPAMLTRLGLVNSASAQVGGVTILGNIPQTLREVLQDALGASFSNFFSVFAQELISKLESNYKISNFLYYTDALASGQYLNDYLTKYVSSPLDQSLIKRFIPQISCADNQSDLGPIFETKAKQYFNAANLNPNAPDYYEKLASAGRIDLSTAAGQQNLYKEYASGALAKSYDAAMTELLNQNGLKVPRDTTGKAIAVTITSLAGTLQSAISSNMNLGVYNANSIVSKLVAKGLTAFEQKFIFTGVVIKEQNTCISYPQLQPVIPGTLPQYTP